MDIAQRVGSRGRPIWHEVEQSVVWCPVPYYSYSKLSSTMLYDETKVAVLYDSYNTAGSFDPPTQNIYSPVTHVIHFLECQISWLFSRTHNDSSLSWPNVYTFFPCLPTPLMSHTPTRPIPHPADVSSHRFQLYYAVLSGVCHRRVSSYPPIHAMWQYTLHLHDILSTCHSHVWLWI